jgi:anti-anti-sigma factor
VKISVTVGDELTVAAVHGEIDFENTGDLSKELRATVSNRAMGLVLDLRRTDFVDSAGLGFLFDVMRRLGRREQQLHVVVAADSLVADLLTEVGLATYASVHTDLAEAIAELQALERA